MALSEKSKLILEAIAKGHSYEQILVQELAWTYHDIFNAAKEALNQPSPSTPPSSTYAERLGEIRSENPRAYEKWSEEDDNQLKVLFAENRSIAEMAATFQRQPSAIRSRLRKLNLTS